jgi:hypothetical protein
MSNSYSLINDLYGVEPARRRPERQGVLGLVIVMVLAGMFFYESVRPVMRLRSNPPSDFVKGTANRKATGTKDQEYIARSYWDLATDFASQKYSYGELLPSNPPEDFAVSSGEDYATRALYWQRLRGLWNQQDIWVRSYELDTDWINDALGSLSKVVKDYLNIH